MSKVTYKVEFDIEAAVSGLREWFGHLSGPIDLNQYFVGVQGEAYFVECGRCGEQPCVAVGSGEVFTLSEIMGHITVHEADCPGAQ